MRSPTSTTKPAYGTRVTLNGLIVTSTKFKSSNGWQAVFVSDQAGGEWRGVTARFRDSAVNYAPGEIVNVAGKWENYKAQGAARGADQINEAVITKTGQTAPAPDPVDISDAADIAANGSRELALYSVLVRLNDVTITKPADQYNEFEVNGKLIVDDLLKPQGGQWYSATCGDRLASMVGFAYYSYGAAKLVVRSKDDFGTVTPAQAESATASAVQQAASAPAGACISPKSFATLVATTQRFVESSNDAGVSLYGVFAADSANAAPWAAVKVVYPPSVFAGDIGLGQTITASGNIEEYFANTQVKARSVSIVTATPASVTPLNVTPIELNGGSGEQYEGVLVRLANVEVKGPAAGCTTNCRPVVGTGSDPSKYVTLLTKLYNPTGLSSGATCSEIIGVVSSFVQTSDAGSTTRFDVMPRTAADVRCP
jgi:hypothetical protein